MNIYVAGKIQDYERVRRIQDLCRQWGHDITHDWTIDVEQNKQGGEVCEAIHAEDRRRHAAADLKGVSEADCLIALGHPALCGTLIEIGYALAHGMPVFLVDTWYQRSCFFDLPFVYRVAETELKECISVLVG